MKRKKKQIIWSAAVLAGLLLVCGVVGWFMAHDIIYRQNIEAGEKGRWLFIPTGSEFENVMDLLRNNGLKDEKSFRWVAEKMNYQNHVKPGRYHLARGMTNLELVRMLRSGRQIPVRVTFNNIRTGAQLAGKVAPTLECDSSAIAQLFTDSAFLKRFDLTPATALSMFIPNTYEMMWNTGAEEFWQRMNKEYQRFWNEARRKKAKEIGLSPLQVSILASIVDEETNRVDEKPVIAGVYMNRLNKGIPLQACPTVRFVLGDYTITRVLKKHTEMLSPYNTYLHAGLPPGPICVPSIEGLDAVLNYERHDYLFFCAKADFSGTHHFSRTLAQHNRYAQQYQAEYTKRRRQK